MASTSNQVGSEAEQKAKAATSAIDARVRKEAEEFADSCPLVGIKEKALASMIRDAIVIAYISGHMSLMKRVADTLTK